MKNFYKRLSIEESATDPQIREALAAPAVALDVETRDAAAHVLLDPTRRAAYDRTHRVLATVGELRSHLGLNLSSFWVRGKFRDYTQDLTPPPVAAIRRFSRPTGAVRAIGSADLSRAFGLHGPQYQVQSGRRQSRVLKVSLLLIALGLAAVALLAYTLFAGK